MCNWDIIKQHHPKIQEALRELVRVHIEVFDELVENGDMCDTTAAQYLKDLRERLRPIRGMVDSLAMGQEAADKMKSDSMGRFDDMLEAALRELFGPDTIVLNVKDIEESLRRSAAAEGN